MQLLFRDILDREDAGIFQLHQEDRLRAILGLGIHLKFDGDVILFVLGALFRVEVDLNLNVRRWIAVADTFLRGNIFKAHVFDVLRQNLHFGLNRLCGGCAVLFGHICTLLSVNLLRSL